MSHALSRPSASHRGSLFGAAVGLHGAVLLGVLAAKTVIPETREVPLVVDLIQPAQTEAPKTRPQALPRPQPAPPQAAPQRPTPPLAATTSSVPAANAPLAAPPESKPAPAAPAAAAAAAAEAVSAARFDADYLKNPAPVYPPLARRMGEEGRVVLRVQVTAQGTADSVELMTSSGSDRLDQAALKAVRNWRFVPARRGGEAVASAVLVPITFKLEP